MCCFCMSNLSWAVGTSSLIGFGIHMAAAGLAINPFGNPKLVFYFGNFGILLRGIQKIGDVFFF